MHLRRDYKENNNTLNSVNVAENESYWNYSDGQLGNICKESPFRMLNLKK